MIRILCVDDHPLFRVGLMSVLQKCPDFQVVGEASNGVEAVAAAAKTQPDVIIMDVYMRGGDGFEGTELLRKQSPGVKILILTMSNSEEDMFRLVRAGANGYLLKTVRAEELIDSVTKLAAGEGALSPSMAAKLMNEFRNAVKEDGKRDFRNLSAREREILQLAAKGSTNKEIADQCFISETTVKAHFRNILEKLDAKNRAGAVAIATSKGLLKEHASY